jgi:pimeloyl-ACP methyl ester carboxylesterase
MFEWAEQVGALVIWAEHRFYGVSLPFGNDSFTHTNLGYLSVEQALGDFAEVIRHVKETYAPNIAKSPVFAFGGSYGGMLASWFRQKYPNVVEGSLASSAPVVQWPGIGDDFMFFNGVTRDFEQFRA